MSNTILPYVNLQHIKSQSDCKTRQKNPDLSWKQLEWRKLISQMENTQVKVSDDPTLKDICNI